MIWRYFPTSSGITYLDKLQTHWDTSSLRPNSLATDGGASKGIAASINVDCLVACARRTCSGAHSLCGTAVIWAIGPEKLVSASRGGDLVGLESGGWSAGIVIDIAASSCSLAVLVAVQLDNGTVGSGDECGHQGEKGSL